MPPYDFKSLFSIRPLVEMLCPRALENEVADEPNVEDEGNQACGYEEVEE